LNKEFARRFVMAAAAIFNRFVVFDRYLPGKARDVSDQASHRDRSWENRMQKTILTIAGAALIALSTVQFAAASEHQARHHRSANAQFRQSNAYVAPAPELPGYGYGDGYYSHGFSAPAGH
jgi:ATP-dependent Clp protease ATP-binding subunit ClpA